MARANEIKLGMAINYHGKLLLVKDIDCAKLERTRCQYLIQNAFSDVRTGLKVEERFKGSVCYTTS